MGFFEEYTLDGTEEKKVHNIVNAQQGESFSLIDRPFELPVSSFDYVYDFHFLDRISHKIRRKIAGYGLLFCLSGLIGMNCAAYDCSVHNYTSACGRHGTLTATLNPVLNYGTAALISLVTENPGVVEHKPVVYKQQGKYFGRVHHECQGRGCKKQNE